MTQDTGHKWLKKLKRIYHFSPFIVIKAYSRVYALWRMIRSFWLPVYYFKGLPHDGIDLLHFIYIGWNYCTINYWLTKIFMQYEKEPYRKLIPKWRINKYLKENIINGDLALVEVSHKPSRQLSIELPGFVLPKWVKMYMDVDLVLEPRKKINAIQNAIKRYSLSVEKAYSDQDFIFFYEKLYKPYIESRHKESAVVEKCKEMLHNFKRWKSTLYFIVKNGVRIAGMYEHLDDGFPYMHALGVLDASEDIMKMKVIGALYYFSLEDHKKNNVKHVNIGGTSPLINDGLTRYKISLGSMVQNIKHQKSERLKLLPLNNTKEVKRFLISNPLIFFEDKNIYCAIFKDDVDAESDKERVQKYCNLAKEMNIQKVKVIGFKEPKGLIEYIV